MGRLFLLLLLALGIGLYFPGSRAVVLDYTRPLANPAYRWMTSQELRQIVADLEVIQGAGQSFPARPDEFDTWLDNRYRQESSRVDAWGNRYRLEITATHFRVLSSGPDGRPGTGDDLVQESLRSGSGG